MKKWLLIVVASIAALLSLPVQAQLADTRFPVSRSAGGVTASSVGLLPDAPGINDYTQSKQPSLAVAQAHAAAINAAVTAYGTVVFDQPGTYYIGSAISVQRSNVALIASVPGVVIKTHTSMFDFHIVAGTLDRTSAGRNLGTCNFTTQSIANLRLEGIEFQRSGQVPVTSGPGPGGGNGWDGHTIRISNGYRGTVTDCRFTSYNSSGKLIGGKYCILFNNCKGWTIKDNYVQNASDGFHFHAPCEDITIDGVYGFTGDNMIALTQGDYITYETTYGNFKRFRIANLYPDVPRKPDGTTTTQYNGTSDVPRTGCVEPVRFTGHDAFWVSGTTTSDAVYTSSGYGFEDIHVDGVFGPVDSQSTTVKFTADVPNNAAGAGRGATTAPMNRMKVSSIRTTVAAGYGRVAISMPTLNTLDVDDVECVSGTGYAIDVLSGGGSSNLVLRCNNIRNLAPADAAHLFNINSAIGTLIVNNSEQVPNNAANSVSFFNIGSGVTIGRLLGNNLRGDYTTGGTCRFMLCSGVITEAKLSNVVLIKPTNAFQFVDTAGYARSKINIDNLAVETPLNYLVGGRCDLHVSGIYRQLGKGGLVNYSGTGQPTLLVDPQWSEVQLFQGAIPKDVETTTQNDFGVFALPTKNVTLNVLTRYANVAGQGFFPRGTMVLQWSARCMTTFTGATSVTFGLGTATSLTKFGSGTVNLQAVSTSTRENVLVPVASQWDNESADQDINVQGVANVNWGNGSTATITPGGVSIRIVWVIVATGN